MPRRFRDASQTTRIFSVRLFHPRHFVVDDVEAEIGGDDDLVADRCERRADDLLVAERAVHLGGVEEGDAAGTSLGNRYGWALGGPFVPGNGSASLAVP